MRLVFRRPPPATAVHTTFLREFHITPWPQVRSKPGRSALVPFPVFSSIRWTNGPRLDPSTTSRPLQETPWQRPQSRFPDSNELEDSSVPSLDSHGADPRLNESFERLEIEGPHVVRSEPRDNLEAEDGDIVRLPTDVANVLSKAADLIIAGKIAFARLRIQQKLTAAILHLHRIPGSQLSHTAVTNSSAEGRAYDITGSCESKDEGQLAYRLLAEGALKLFLDARDLDGAELVLLVLHTHGAEFTFSLQIKARLSAARYACRDETGKGKISKRVLFKSLKGIFPQRKFLASPTIEDDFHSILKQLVFISRPNNSRVEQDEKDEMLATMERVVQTYARCQRDRVEREIKRRLGKKEDADIRGRYRWVLDAWTIAFMISRNFESGRAKRAGYWLRQTRWLRPHYRVKASLSPWTADSGDSDTTQAPKIKLPYKAYLFHALRLRHSPDHVAALSLPRPFCISPDDRDPRNIYGPFLEKMKADGVSPDSELVNIVLRTESEMGAWGRVVSVYDELQSRDDSVWQGAKPDEETFRFVFNAHSEAIDRLVVRRIQVATAGSANTSSVLAPLISPRTSPEFDIEEGQHRNPKYVFSDLINQLATPLSHDFAERESSPLANPDARENPINTELTSPAIASALSYFVLDADYAAALVALRVIARFDIDIPKGLVGKILDALVERCRRELMLPPLPSSSATQLSSLPLLPEERRRLSKQQSGSGHRTNLGWVDLFLNLQDSSSAGLGRRRLRGESVQETSRRVVSVARRALALAELDAMGNEAADAPEDYASSSGDSGDNAIVSDEGQGEAAHEPSYDRRRSEVPADTSSSSRMKPRTSSQTQQRNLEIIDVLLSRALATECFLDGASDPSEAGRRAVEDAANVMLKITTSGTNGRKNRQSSDVNDVASRALPSSEENNGK